MGQVLSEALPIVIKELQTESHDRVCDSKYGKDSDTSKKFKAMGEKWFEEASEWKPH